MKSSTLYWRGNILTPPLCSTLEVYNETHIFIPVDIMKDVVESAMQKLSGGSFPGGTYSEAIQGWLLKLGGGV